MIVSWMTTNQCNLTCKHCYQDAGNQKETELTTEEGKKLIDEIARAGFKIMIFSGGEPLMRPDIYELVAYAVDAVPFIQEPTLEQILEADRLARNAVKMKADCL